jgi:uncharacterized integral membrane protein
MNFKLIFKSLVILAVLALLVIMGMNNRRDVELSMPFFRVPQHQPAALMYFAFFALGFLVGAVLMSGGGSKKSGSSAPSKPSKA